MSKQSLPTISMHLLFMLYLIEVPEDTSNLLSQTVLLVCILFNVEKSEVINTNNHIL